MNSSQMRNLCFRSTSAWGNSVLPRKKKIKQQATERFARSYLEFFPQTLAQCAVKRLQSLWDQKCMELNEQGRM